MSEHGRFNKQLTAYALGELSEAPACQVKAHLGECASCRKEMRRIEALLECAEQMSQSSADEDAVVSAGELLGAVIENAKTAKQPGGRSMSPAQVWRTIMKSKTTKLAAAAVIIVAVLISINQLGVTSLPLCRHTPL